jgi:hypothetical protein
MSRQTCFILDYCDTIFIIHGHHDKNLEAPFGATAHYEESRA